MFPCNKLKEYIAAKPTKNMTNTQNIILDATKILVIIIYAPKLHEK